MPVAKSLACLDLEQKPSFLDGHYIHPSTKQVYSVLEDQDRKRVKNVLSTGDINGRKFPVATILVLEERE